MRPNASNNRGGHASSKLESARRALKMAVKDDNKPAQRKARAAIAQYRKEIDYED